MSEIMTSISVNGDCGLMDRGRKSRAEMIKRYRALAERQKAEAEAVLSATDDQFLVERHTGSYCRRNIVELKP